MRRPLFRFRLLRVKAAPGCALVLCLARGPCLSSRAQDKSATPAAAAAANSHNLSPELESLLKDGWELHDKHQDDAARARLERALTLARNEKNIWAEGEAHRVLGLLDLQAANYPAAETEFDQALGLFEKVPAPGGIARVHQHLGAVASYMGKPEEAAELYHKALFEYEGLRDRTSEAMVLQNLALVEALPAAERYAYLERGLGLAKELGNKALAGQFLHSMGDGLFAQGDYAGAIEKLSEAATTLEEAGDRFALATVWTSLGRLYRVHGAYDDAISYYKKGLSIQEELGDKFGVIQSLNAMAISYGLAGNGPEAIGHYEHALALARETGSPRVIAFMTGNLGGAYNNGEERTRAIELLEESLRLDPASYYAGGRKMQLADAYRVMKDYAKALEHANEAVRLTRQAKDYGYLSQALQTRSKVYGDLQNFPEALADILDAIAQVELLRTKIVPSDYLKQGYANLTQDYFEAAIRLHEKLGQRKEAMIVAEEARARAFLDLLATRGVKKGANQNSALTSANSTPGSSSSAGPASSAPLKGQAVGVTARGATPLMLGIANGKAALPSPVSAGAPSFEELVSTAKRLDSTLVSYWVMSDATYIWVLKADGTVRGERITAGTEEISKLVRATAYSEEVSPEESPATTQKKEARTDAKPVSTKRGTQTLALRGGEELVLGGKEEQAWRQLYKLLIFPVREYLPAQGSHLTIVPQGPLFRLSFAALQDAQGHYLVESYALNYAPSLGVLRMTGERKQQLGQREPRYLVVADPQIAREMSKESGLPPLPGAREEARNLVRLLPHGQATLLMGGDASKQAVRDQSAGKTVLHLATHAIVRDDQPLDSFLVLSASDKSPPGSGRLTVQEIYGMDLQTDLVVLSACRTALGKVSGDGMAGLTRAFFYGGAPSVMATLWDVADRPTSNLISDFYRSLLKGQDKSRALRTAQLRLIRQLRAGRVKVSTPLGPVTLPEDPVFWAGFVLQGEP